ncbi:peptide/nickel transport system ATP-binding protein [Azospirillum lipoferum]|uniref:ATP-binding cassette domain-containing protein n=1 Tax=Azospirillum lipoferum TaxID=193 RepID=A0A5A9GNN2_AZOLI|nr:MULTISPECIES: oligopeptide/dipeptide ABC transporter ATP-binding protein [Azospirillum]KAA0595214.1 ATP-binding cassette domain-containing protein [Azospirillum lipoferum]MCP1611913.1 peptide/nickel transport system ATP-binding protein [Azospirillum lipoferum]MDW5533328.1 ATP-binding cassette domain-containing protein [Azospirillum sp. NL1]
MTVPVLELDNVTKIYPVPQGMFKPRAMLTAVGGVSLTVARGEVHALVGESGSGKSTLAKMLLGLTKPTAGEIRIDGVPIAQTDRREVARRIQPVFQDPYSSLNPRKSVADLIALPLVAHGIGTSASRQKKVAEMLDAVGLPRRMIDAYPGQMSGGQRQRVAIARALVMQPDVLICDEPTSALDVSVQAQILNLLMDLKREFKLTYFFISHNLAVVEHLADRVAVMYLGRIVEERGREALFTQASHPYSRALLDCVLTPDPSLGMPDTVIAGSFPNPIAPPPGCAFHPRCPRATDRCHAEAPGSLPVADGVAACHYAS